MSFILTAGKMRAWAVWVTKSVIHCLVTIASMALRWSVLSTLHKFNRLVSEVGAILVPIVWMGTLRNRGARRSRGSHLRWCFGHLQAGSRKHGVNGITLSRLPLTETASLWT